MSSAHAHGSGSHGHRHHLHAATADGRDPTRTKTVRDTYAQRLRGPFGRINAKIRKGIVAEDRLDLQAAEVTADISPLPSQFPEREDQQVETFNAWLERQQDQEVLTVIGKDRNRFLDAGYERGLRQAETLLRDAGVKVVDEPIEATLRRPVHRDTLELLYTRDYSDLEGITAEVSKQANRTLAQGLAQGLSSSDIANNLTDRIDAIGKTRSTTLARTSVIDAHASATLNRYEEMGVDSVTGKAELMTAGDRRVCAQCQSLEGTVYTVKEARGVIPVHARCRCAWVPVVGS